VIVVAQRNANVRSSLAQSREEGAETFCTHPAWPTAHMPSADPEPEDRDRLNLDELCIRHVFCDLVCLRLIKGDIAARKRRKVSLCWPERSLSSAGLNSVTALARNCMPGKPTAAISSIAWRSSLPQVMAV
jgi:hypothetical protein